MKKIFILSFSVILTLFQTACSPNTKESTSKSESNVSVGKIINIEAKEFFEKSRDEDAMIIDVRTAEEIKHGYIEGAGFIDLNSSDFIQRINLMEKYRPVFLYSESGSKSANAAKLFRENGFDTIYNLLGGAVSWKKSGFPLIKSPSKVKSLKASLSLSEFDNLIDTENVVLVDFYTQWCAPCKKMAPIIEELKVEFNDKAKVLKVDADAQNDIAIKYEIAAVPTFIVFQGGKEVWRQIGLVEMEVLVSTIDNLSNENIQ